MDATMISIPFIVLSYGSFDQNNKKLFSYESEGVHILPVFTSPSTAEIFINSVNRTLHEYGDDRCLMPQVCNKLEHAYSILVTIATLTADLSTVCVDPAPPGALDLNISDNTQRTFRIDQIIEFVQDQLAINQESPTSEEDSDAESGISKQE